MNEMNNSAPALMDHSFEASDSAWNEEIDLDVWYQAERAEVEDVVRDALDLSVWSLESKKEQTMVYLHCKNNETQTYAVRAVTRITGSVQSVIECLRSPDSATLRTFNKLFHARVFLDSEVLHAHQEHPEESLTLKWLAFSNGKNTLGRGKEFCIREYTTIVRDHDAFGTFGVCKFESYDGLGARYAVRGKSDSFSKTLFEPSSFVVYEAAEDGMVVVTMTFAMQKARGTTNCVSSGVKALSMRLAHDLSNLQHAVQHTRFLPTSLADKREWVNDSERSNCSLCVQTFSMLKRRHHCRVCGEVVCSSCTVFKIPTANLESTNGKIRVCKACLGKGSSESQPQKPLPPVDTIAISPSKSNNQQFKNITLSTFSSSSTSSDESRRSGDDAFSSSLVKGMNSSSMYMNKHSTSSSSFSECEGGPSPRHHSQPASSFKQPIVLSSGISNRNKHSENRTQYFNEDFQEICMLAMETLQCAMAGIRTDDFELVTSFDGQSHPELPRSLPTFRRIASRGKPCIVLDVSSDKRISGEKRTTAKLQFFIGIPLILDGEVVGDLCVADRHARDTIDHKAVEVLMVLGKTITQYMTTRDYIADLADFKMNQRRKRREHKEAMGLNSNSFSSLKEVAF